MGFECSFLVVRVSQGFLLVIDTNTRVKYLTGNCQKDSEQYMTGLSPLYKPNGDLDTVTKDELEYLLEKAIDMGDDDIHTMFEARFSEHVGLHTLKL